MPWSARFPTSKYECQIWQDTPVNCSSLTFGIFESNGDIAGQGVVWSFSVALILTVIVTLIAIGVQAADFCGADLASKLDENGKPKPDTWRIILEAFLLGLSDTQLVTGLALMIVTEFNMACSISAYHYDLVCDMVLMSLIVHLCSMTVIEHYFDVWYLASLRILLIAGNFILGFLLFIHRAYKNFPVGLPSQSPSQQEGINATMITGDSFNRTSIVGASLVMPAVCFMDNSTITNAANQNSSSIVSFVEYILLFIFFAVAVLLSLMHTHFFKLGRPFKTLHWTYFLRGAMSVAAFGVSIYLINHVVTFQAWMLNSGWFGDDDGESSMDSFGQIVPLVLLALPFLALLEAMADAFQDRNKGSSEKRDDDSS